jgi:hypothetical protein
LQIILKFSRTKLSFLKNLIIERFQISLSSFFLRLNYYE